MLSVSSDSPRSPIERVYVVRNTFVEFLEANNVEPAVEEVSMPAFRRRRGSSFFRSSSEPLVEGGRRRQPECKDDTLGEGISTEDEDSEGISTPEVSPTSSRAGSPLGSRSPMYAGESQFPNQSGQNVFTAAMHAGFNAGLFTAMAMKEPQQQQQQQAQRQMPLGSAPYRQGVRMGQMPFYFEALNPPFAFSKHMEKPLQHPAARAQEPSPVGQHSSNSSESGAASHNKQPCHFIWCDHRAFKDTASTLKAQLEAGSGAVVKTHKTAENCIRLFRKKQRAQGRPPCVILVSWANAPALLSYLAECDHILAKVVVLCDARSCRKNESAEQLVAQYPFIEKVVTTWDEAVESACNCVAASN